MTDLLRRIEDIVAPTVVGMGFELVRVAMSKGGTLQLMIEPADGRPLDVEDCATVSRAVSAVLDVEDPIPQAYTLEVSSPGIDRPLTKEKDFEDFTGLEARVEIFPAIEGQKRFKGILRGLEDGAVKLETENGPVTLRLETIQKARLVLNDDLIAKTRQRTEKENGNGTAAGR